MVLWAVACFGVSNAHAVTINGHAYVSLPEVAKRFGMDHRWLSANSHAEIASKWSSLKFKLHQRYFQFNGQRVYLGVPIALHKQNLYISERDYAQTLKPLLFPHRFDPKPKLYHIVIDAGHGGKDGGAQNSGLKLKEKSLALDLSKRLKTKLERYGYKVTMTRDNDRFIDLKDRPAIANKLNADLFISIHFNAVDSSKVDGAECFVMTPAGHPSTNHSKVTSGAKKTYPGNQDNPWSLLAGYHIQKEMVGSTNASDRGLKRARFAVLRDLKCPGVLVEGGFITHPREGRNIGSAAYREKIADGIVSGILQYQKALNRARGIDS